MFANPEPSGSLKRLRVFFLLVFALSLPFWLLGAATDLQLMPGLSVSALFSGNPLPMRFYGLFLVRNDRIVAA